MPNFSDGYFQNYVNNQEYTPYWQPVSPVNTDPDTKPGMRGGHQMCVDPYTETIYLLGGWDGNQDLSDLWAYSIPTNKWTLLCREAELMGGPTPRSCHKMCLDTKRQQLFTFGRYLDTLNRSPESLKVIIFSSFLIIFSPQKLKLKIFYYVVQFF